MQTVSPCETPPVCAAELGCIVGNPALDEALRCRLTGTLAAQVVNGMFAATTGLIDDRWQRFMQFQIERTRQIFAEAEAGVNLLAPDARLPVWCARRSSATPSACANLTVLTAQATLLLWFEMVSAFRRSPLQHFSRVSAKMLQRLNLISDLAVLYLASRLVDCSDDRRPAAGRR